VCVIVNATAVRVCESVNITALGVCVVARYTYTDDNFDNINHHLTALYPGKLR